MNFGRACKYHSGFLATIMVIWLSAMLPAIAVAGQPAQLRVITDDNFPPFLYRNDEGAVIGYLVDYWKLWESKTGVPVILTATRWDEAQKQVLAGEADVIDMIFKTPAREPLYDFTDPYADLPVSVYTHKSISGITGVDTLKGFRIGVEEGDACREMLYQRGITHHASFANYAELFDAAQREEIKIFCVDEIPAGFYLNKLGLQSDFRRSFRLYTGQFRRGVPRGHPETLELVKRGMAAIDKVELKGLEEKWFGLPLPDLDSYIHDFATILAAMAGIGLIALFWIFMLRRQVAARTRDLQQAYASLLEQRATLQRSEERFRRIFTNDMVPMAVWNFVGGITEANDAYLTLIGYSRADLESGNICWGEITPPEYSELDLAAIDEIKQNGFCIPYEKAYRHRAGHQVPILIGGGRLDDSAGSVVLFALDLTSRKQAEKALRHREAVLSAIFSRAGDAIEMTDLKTLRIFEFNDAACSLLGYTREEYARLRLPDTHIDMTEEDIYQRIYSTPENQGRVFESRLRRKDGSIVDVEIRGRTIEVEGHRYILALWSDISERKKTRQRLEDSEQRLRLATSAARMGVWEFEFSGNRLYWSPEIYSIFGLPSIEPSIEWLESIRHEEDRGLSDAAIQKALATRTPYFCQYRIVFQGKTIWIEDHGTIHYTDDGQPERIIGLAQDITRRKIAEAALQESEARLRTLLLTLPDLVWLKDVNGVFLTCNRRFEQFLGASESEIVGRTDFDFVPASLAEFFRAKDQAAIANGGFTINEEEITFASDGHRELLQTIKTPIYSGDGRLIGVLGVGRDITRMRNDEKELEGHRQRLEELVRQRTFDLENANRRLSLSDQRLSAMLAMSQKLHELDEEQLLKMGVDEAVRLTGSEIGCLHFIDEDQETISLRAWSSETLKKCSASADGHYAMSAAGVWGDAILLRRPVIHNDYQNLADRKGVPGEHIPLIRHIGAPVIDGGKVRLVIGVGNKATPYDQSDVEQLQLIGNDLWSIVLRQRVETALAEAKDAAEVATRAKSMFLASMSHEIRTPMNAVLGMIYLLANTSLNERQRLLVERLHSSGKLLLGLINDILDFSRIEEGRLEIEVAEFHPGEMLDNLASLFRQVARDKGISLFFDIHPGLPYPLVGDSLRLTQVLTNLLSNAIKFTSAGHVVLSVILLGEENDLVRLGFAVSDTGIGMTPDQQKRLFQPFSQADSGTTRRFGGSGLGLAISHNLVRLMGGELEVSSRLSHGTEFTFQLWFPVGSWRERVLQLPENLPRGRALLLASREVVLKSMRDTFKGLGFQVEEAVDGAHARELLRQSSENASFDLLVLAELLDGDGLGFAEALMASGQHLPPVIFVSSTGCDSEEKRMHELGIRARVVHPVTASDWFDAIMKIFGRPGVRRKTTTSLVKIAAEWRPKLQGLQVLLAEDNPINQELAQDLLSDVGAIVTVVADGVAAVAAVNQARYDIVLMDVQMPVMDGYEATRRIIAEGKHPELPIVAMTADVSVDDRTLAQEAGMVAHVAKPINPTDLYSCLAHWSRRSSSEPASEVDVKSAMLSTATPADEAIPAEWLELPGLDAVGGVARCGGRCRRWRHLLEQFKHDHDGVIKLFEQWLSARKWTEARARAHAMKGVAGNLGLTLLAVAAADLEMCCRRESSEQADISLTRLRDALDTTALSLERCLAVALPEAAPAFPSSASVDREALAELRQALLESDFKATTLLQTMEPALLAFSGLTHELEQVIGAYRFEEAVALLDRIIAMLPPPTTHMK